MNIIELELLSDDLIATEKFYKKVLGLNPSFVEKEALFFEVGYTKLIFKKSDNQKPVYHFAIDLPNNRFFDAHYFIKANTTLIKVEDDEIANFVNWDAKSFYFYDNNGNIVECITRYPQRPYDEAAFSSKSYISVSEVGLVTNNVKELADTLAREEGVPIFKRQPRTDTFTVSGDDEGLFIIALKGRDWYPTTLKAQSFRTRVLFMQNGELEHIVR
ncbi:hypothetical protein R1T16_16605 [Flavobacterium sp. DG1-102-2]|uniref:VOC family protein n=1 Tax=Flavobacterium sp. DG1-102-2 TaxID=3081663 RepID=UPI00294A13D1|nr:hypothetical protein [Flavobacterium sp. DG1-102-2]MDV6170061.1 hypothetical protein [Flavobacterium sp. DG1-102-2]